MDLYGSCGYRARPLHRLSAVEPITLYRSRSDPDGHPQSQPTAGAIDFLEFVNALHRNVARQLLTIREPCANGFGRRLSKIGGGHPRHRHHGAHALWTTDGRRKGYNPKTKVKEELSTDADLPRRDAGIRVGELRNGDRPSGKQIHNHLRNARQALPLRVKQIYGRADSAFTAEKLSKRTKN